MFQNNNIKITLEVIDKPEVTLEKLMDPLKAGLAHEEYVTGLINTIYDAAQNVKDFRTMQFWIGSLKSREKKKQMLMI